MKFYFYPNKAIGHAANFVLGGLGHEIVFTPEDADMYVWWKFTAEHEDFPDILKDKPCINSECCCSLKTFVEERFVSIFGESTFIDPTTYEGVAVEKSNKNATHDGRLVQCPTEGEDGKIYQRLLGDQDNLINYRLPVICGEVPYVSVEHKNDMFEGVVGGGVVWCDIVKPEELFSDEWLAKLKVFCDGYIDFGEVDVLDGCIIDVNSTASAAPHYNPEDEELCKGLYCDLFKKHYG